MDKQDAKLQIQRLVEKYRRGEAAGRVRSYSEAQTRNEFIEPLFECLGWDMRNATNEGEVTTEERVSKGRVDLAFRVGNVPAFFLEAKSPKADVEKREFAEQAINYCWNKSVAWAVLTDFATLKVLNAEIPPRDISQNLFFEIECGDFVQRFDQLWLLSKESFLERLLDREAEKWGKVTACKQVGERLFDDLMSWRNLLTKEFRVHNPSLAGDELDEGVQRVLDRLVFVRTAEDRAIEPVSLRSILRSGKLCYYEQLVKTFRDFDDRFNSKLFARHYSEAWTVSDKAIGAVVEGLYTTSDGYRYDFSAISTDVLGGIYEQYLSFVQARNGDDKSKSKRKSQGIYYTPKYIVDFIVQETLGEVLKKTKPKDLAKVKVLDPACGSGSFLTTTYDHILNAVKQHKPHLSLFDEFDILEKNIFGVDLDPQAVEIAQLNLLLKVLSQRARLPMLQHRLRVGNSLVSSGELHLKPFDFKAEFPEVFARGGFDVIVGNPPYVKEYTNRAAFDALHASPYYQGKMDIWTLLACRAIDMLRDGGFLGLIAPNSWLTNAGASIFRDKVLSEGEIVKLVDFGDFKVFKDAGIQTMILIFRKCTPRRSYKTVYAKVTDKTIGDHGVKELLRTHLRACSGVTKFPATIKPKLFTGKTIAFSNRVQRELLEKIESKKNFSLTAKEVANGIHPHYDFVSKSIAKKHRQRFCVGEGIFVLSHSEKTGLHLTKKEQELVRPYFTTEQLGRYYAHRKNQHWIIYTDASFKNPKSMASYPHLKSHLDKFRRVITSDNKPYGLHRARDEQFFVGEKIVALRKCTERPVFTYTDFSCYVSAAFYVIKTDRVNQKYLTGLLNSTLIKYWLKHKGKMQGSNFQLDKEPLLGLPLLKPRDTAQEKIAALVESMMRAVASLRATPAHTDKHDAIQREITKLERQIDSAVYKLYGLTKDEIAIVES